MKHPELAKKFALAHLAAVGFNPMFMKDDKEWLEDQLRAYAHYPAQLPAVTPFDERKKRPRKGTPKGGDMRGRGKLSHLKPGPKAKR